MTRTVLRVCTLCEATCGLRLTVDGDRVVSVEGDPDDPLSRGFLCAKGAAIGEVHCDPDRLRAPVRRTGDGRFEPISWDDALDLAAERIEATRERYGRDAVGVYYGNPTVYDHGATLWVSALLDTLGTRNRFGPNSQDINPRLAASHYLYGDSWAIPVPDVDRTAYFLCIGANPVVSNGSLLTAPGLRRRLRSLRERGGMLVVVDPRRSETAAMADRYLAIRPGADAALLLAMLQVLSQRSLLDRRVLDQSASGWRELATHLDRFAPERVAHFCGIEARDIEQVAVEFARAERAVAYGRMGVSAGHFATLATWAIDALNVATGRLGCVGGAMFPRPAIDLTRLLKLAGAAGHGRWASRVRGLPETVGDLPAAAMAEEIETPGEGRIRTLLTCLGNPVLSVPDGRRLARALEKLDFMVSVDLYVNETTRHADLILPPSWHLTHDRCDLVFPLFSVRNVVRWSPPVFAPREGELADWQILRALTERLGGGLAGVRPVDACLRWLRRARIDLTPTSIVALLLRTGPYGDKFLPWSKGLNLERVRRQPHGVDLGPMPEGIAHRVAHRGGRVCLDPSPLSDELERLAAAVEAGPARGLVLIGRREPRTNNSWMHNIESMVAGVERCVLFVHPEDAKRAGVTDGADAVLESRVHRGKVRVRVTDEVRPGVVSLPHGWGHGGLEDWQRVASAHPGVSANDWTDEGVVEGVVAQSVLNGVPVQLEPCAGPEAA